MLEKKSYHKIIQTCGDWQLIQHTQNETDVCFLDFSNPPVAFSKDVFDSCPFKDAILGAQHNVLAVFLTGSACMEATHERSDYDLVVFVDGGDVTKSPYKVIYKGRGLHWFYQDISFINSADDVSKLNPLLIGQLLSYCYLKADHVLYTADSDKAKLFVTTLLEKAAELSVVMCELYCGWMQLNGKFDWILDENSDLKRMKKCSWFRYFAPAKLNGEDIDFDLIRNMKAIHRLGLNEGDAQKLRSTIRAYINTHKKPTKTYLTKLEKEIVALWKNIRGE